MKNTPILSRCGLCCDTCEYRESHSCGGCIATNGNPFHGECPIAQCCQRKELTHCGECNIIPCADLYEYSYTNPEHDAESDKPQGKRVEQCRKWAAQSGKQKWHKVLLTDAGWYHDYRPYNQSTLKKNILRRFHELLEKPAAQARVLFIPTAANGDAYFPAVGKCLAELLSAGIHPNHITLHEIDGTLTLEKALEHDAIYVTGGHTAHLLRQIKQFKFDEIIKKMIFANKLYVGASAGSLIATPNIGDPYSAETSGLCLINAYITVHCEAGTPARTDLPLPHIPLTENQALEVRWDGYTLIEG
ncbi:MAG: Type 1 glutamine amidotransferase-like domain-containing protein [Defluviitaleaceae bacterium]|nr:Type 1 glutamine amidotransferase-like domain-containing protein [Defluviitaleaceae bacterium]MCL2274592.1 Type 1 glutamine amidotransferase-like domain-containing protein [Defluviitaleaceae bacterium]